MNKNIVFKSSLALLASFAVISSISQIKGSDNAYTPIQADAQSASCSIDYVNLAFQDSIYLLYAVKVENTTSLPSMYLWKDGDGIYDIEDAIELPIYKEHETINGHDYTLFQYTGLTAKQMSDYVYTKACVDNQLSELVKYSIVEYATKEIKNSSNQAIIETLEGMLDYGAGAQKLFNYHTERLANDTFYKVTLTDGIFPDGTTETLVTSNEEIKVTTTITHDHWTIAGEESRIIIVDGSGDLKYEGIDDNVNIKPFSLTYSLQIKGYTEGNFQFGYQDQVHYELNFDLPANSYIEFKNNSLCVNGETIEIFHTVGIDIAGFNIEPESFYLSGDFTIYVYCDNDLSLMYQEIRTKFANNRDTMQYNYDTINLLIPQLKSDNISTSEFVELYNQINSMIEDVLLNSHKAEYAKNVVSLTQPYVEKVLQKNGSPYVNDVNNAILDFQGKVGIYNFQEFVEEYYKLFEHIEAYFVLSCIDFDIEEIASNLRVLIDIGGYPHFGC